MSFWSLLNNNNNNGNNSNNNYKTTKFWGNRSEFSKQIITEQIYDIAANIFKNHGVNFDEENADWVVIPNYKLPKNWHHIKKTTDLLILFPTLYPKVPPVGFYLKDDIPYSPDGHLFNEAYHQADRNILKYGWKWYCVYIKPGSWRPNKIKRQYDWEYGDNIWTYLSLIREALSSNN